MNLAALVEYDGTRFAGYQRQAAERGPTVQGALEEALARLTGAQTRIEAAGRTDAGVHASGQVVNFHVAEARAARLDLPTWRRALNALLPSDVAVRAVCVAPEDFRARRSALARSYRYRALVDAVRAPLRERYVWRAPQPLDVAAMDAAARRLLGEHDFGAFGSSPHAPAPDGTPAHTVRTMLAAGCAPSERFADEVEFHFTANAFLTGMVRRLVGTLALVGAGKLSVEGFARVLDAREKALAGAAAPARGLCLVEVVYPAGTLGWTR